MAKQDFAGDIKDVDFSDALGERYLSYALSTIIARSLPDVRDGLKPVHRRLLYAMRELKLDPGSGYKKCARVVGDVIGKFHPHGEIAVYEALVRLAQDFAQRYPLIDGQGNFGNIDGDNAAAMRYTESRLTAVAEALMDGLDEDAVDFRATYDGENEEPVVLPARFPNLLANGASGIAVGMATSIPPHNIAELCDALAHLVRKPRCDVAEIIALVPGPDFPTGGILVEEPSAVAEAYATGRGSFRLRARWIKEPLTHGLYQIVVTEIPYQVQKSRLIERIAQLLEERKLPLLADVRDESTEEVRLVLEPKTRNVDADMLMEQLFRATELEVRVPLEPQRARRHQRAAGDVAQGGAAGLPRPSPRGAAAPLALPRRRNRAPRRDPARTDRRLSQSRRGHPHHPRGRRPQGADDEALAPDRDPGRGDPQHAPARLAPPRGDRHPQGARGADRRGKDAADAARRREAAVEGDRRRDRRAAQGVRRHAARPAPHRDRHAARRDAGRRSRR